MAEEKEFVGPSRMWQTMGYRRTSWGEGRCSLEWDAPEDYTFLTQGGPVVHGGLMTALLDTAMGGATWSVMGENEAFLTADLRVEFLRSGRPGLIRASGVVVRRTRRVVFCSAEATDSDDNVLAVSRCTNIVLPDDGSAGRADRYRRSLGTPPEDARG